MERLRHPVLALGELHGLVVIDEVQLRPELFPVLRVLVDRPDQTDARFLILLLQGGRKRGFEIKYTDRPSVTASQRKAIELLGLERIDIVCPGQASYPLADRIFVTGLARVRELFGK